MDFSIIIPTYYRPELVKKLLRQLENQEGMMQYEIIVVDDSALPELKSDLAQMRQNRAPILYLATSREGPGQARNVGATHARGNFLVFLDDDSEVGPYWLADLYKKAGRGSEADVYYGPVTSAARGYLPFLHTVELEDCPYRSTNIAFSRELFNQLGGFDPQLSHWSEGWDLVTRARKRGARLKYLPHWTCSNHPTYTSPRYFQVRESLKTWEKMTYLLTSHRDSGDIQQYLTQLYASAIWHVIFRAMFWGGPLLWVSGMRAFWIGLMLNLAYDAFRLALAQRHLVRHRFSITGRDAVLYLLLNWTEDLRKLMIAIAIWVFRLRPGRDLGEPLTN